MASKTHSRSTYPASTVRELYEGGDGKIGVFIIGRKGFGNLVLVAGISAGHIIGERFGGGKFMI